MTMSWGQAARQAYGVEPCPDCGWFVGHRPAAPTVGMTACPQWVAPVETTEGEAER